MSDLAAPTPQSAAAPARPRVVDAGGASGDVEQASDHPDRNLDRHEHDHELRHADRVVVARQLTRSFGGQEVIRPLDLAIEPGTILGLIGPSGCGKTTTVRLLTGLLAPTSGDVTVFGRPSCELSAADRSRLGYLPQTPALFPELSLAENLSFHASMYGLPFRRKERLDHLLEWVELAGDRRKRVADASGGMQRRLALAAAFVHDPDVVFLDEPTAGIDPILRDKLWARFRDIAASGKTLVVTTQYVGEAGQCDRVGLLSDGQLLLLDTPQNLRRAAFAGEVVDVRLARPITDAELARVAEQPFVIGNVERSGPSGVRVVVDDATRAMDDIRLAFDELAVDILEMDEHVVDYDEAFVRVVERHRNASGSEIPNEAEADEAEADEAEGDQADAVPGTAADTAVDPDLERTAGVEREGVVP